MQEGSLRADVNVSVLKKGNYEKYLETKDLSYLGTRCEIKNMNSIRFIQQAIDYEAKRQVEFWKMVEKLIKELDFTILIRGKQDRCAPKRKPMITGTFLVLIFHC